MTAFFVQHSGEVLGDAFHCARAQTFAARLFQRVVNRGGFGMRGHFERVKARFVITQTQGGGIGGSPQQGKIGYRQGGGWFG